MVDLLRATNKQETNKLYKMQLLIEWFEIQECRNKITYHFEILLKIFILFPLKDIFINNCKLFCDIFLAVVCKHHIPLNIDFFLYSSSNQVLPCKWITDHWSLPPKRAGNYVNLNEIRIRCYQKIEWFDHFLNRSMFREDIACSTCNFCYVS